MANSFNILMPDDFATFDFNRLELKKPISPGTSNDSFFIKLTNGQSPLYVQTTACSTKKGIVKSIKKYYFDIIFDNYSESIITWFERLEDYCKQTIVNNPTWFNTQLSLDDIEVLYTPIIKIKGKSYSTMTNIKTDDEKELPLIKTYNERHQPVPYQNITENDTFNVLLEITGVRFSPRKIYIEIETKHIMLLDNDKILNTYYIGTGQSKHATETTTFETKQQGNVGGATWNDDHDHDHDQGKPDLEMIDEGETATTLEQHDPEPDDHQQHEQHDPELDHQHDLEDDFELKLDTAATNGEVITLKNPKDHYDELYKEAKMRAKAAKKTAILAYLEAKMIKNTYMVELQESSDFDDEIDEVTEEELNYF
jgi:hypothetical protein